MNFQALVQEHYLMTSVSPEYFKKRQEIIDKFSEEGHIELFHFLEKYKFTLAEIEAAGAVYEDPFTPSPLPLILVAENYKNFFIDTKMAVIVHKEMAEALAYNLTCNAALLQYRENQLTKNRGITKSGG